MVSFDSYTLCGGVPIYQQILLYLKRGAVSGAIADGDELPSRRVLSALLGVNPNTVQKAYRLLEEEGLIVSHTGSKSLMSLTAETLSRLRAELLAADAKEAVRAFRQMGLTKGEAVEWIERFWDKGEE